MNTKTTLSLAAGLAISTICLAQQNPQPQPTQPSQAQQSPCTETKQPAKKPRFGIHIPRNIQDAINKNAKKLSDKTGIDVDPNAPAEVLKDAQKSVSHPCPAPASSSAQTKQ